MSTTTEAKPRGLRRVTQYLKNIRDSFTISRRTYPWISWVLPGIPVALIVIAIVVALGLSQSVWYWIFLAIMLALMLDMIVLSWTVRRASYSQIEGMPGAAKAVIDQIRRGWNVEQEPVFVNPKTQDVIWRLVGRPGVVLVSEGPSGRVRHSLEEEKRKVSRILPTVPVHVIQTGTEDSQTKLLNLERTLRRLPTRPTKLTDAEVMQVSNRLQSLNSKGLPIPKGIDPRRMRPDHRAMRGR